MGWLYTRLVASNSYVDDGQTTDDNEADITEQTGLLTSSHKKLDNSIQEFMAMWGNLTTRDTA
jgi:hypothetical protein